VSLGHTFTLCFTESEQASGEAQMAAGNGRGWKIFGVVVIATVIAAAIAAAAFLIGRGCEKEEEKPTTTTTRTTPAETTPAPVNVAPEEPGAASGTETSPAGSTTETTATTARYVTGEAEGVTLCIGGTRTITRTTYYSDGSTDTSTVTEPCTP